MNDPLLIMWIGFALMLFVATMMVGPKLTAYKTPTRWRKAVSGSLWAISAMFSGGVADPVEKGKVVKVRKRDLDEGVGQDSQDV